MPKRSKTRTVAAILATLCFAALGAASANDASQTLAAGSTPPMLGQTLSAGLRSGTVLIREKGENDFHQLEGIESIPVGSSVDATNGVMWLQAATKEGGFQSIDFYDGRFNAVQDQSGLVTLDLEGADFGSCKGGSKSAKRSPQKLQRLWGNGSGKAKTKGRGGAGTVRGTVWLTEERCNGTFFKVEEGTLKVRDFGRDKTVVLTAGEKYLAHT